MRRCYRGQGEHLEVGGSELADHVSRVEAPVAIQSYSNFWGLNYVPLTSISDVLLSRLRAIIPCYVCQLSAMYLIISSSQIHVRNNVDLFPLGLLSNYLS